MISLIWAMDRNRLIGKDNKMPWNLPADLMYFKRITAGHTVVMGRKTFESLGKPLPERKNVVLTRNRNYQAQGCMVVYSVEEVLKLNSTDGEIFIIGGAEVYSLFLPFADRLYVTLIDAEFQGDSYFEAFDLSHWRLVSEIPGEKNRDNPYDYRFLVYERKLGPVNKSHPVS